MILQTIFVQHPESLKIIIPNHYFIVFMVDLLDFFLKIS